MTQARKREYKVEPSFWNAGKWQVRVLCYPDGVTRLWCDAGDPHDTRRQAEDAVAGFLDADRAEATVSR